MTQYVITIRYIAFAVIATLLNILGQELVIRVLDNQWSWSLCLSIIAGTSIGLIVKYELDKRYIFIHFNSSSRKLEFMTFLLYSSTGVVTTLIFWSVELLFESIYESALMKYLGAVIGLTLGYVIKYSLDNRYVFTGSSEK
jgi:putative flippase GtrA